MIASLVFSLWFRRSGVARNRTCMEATRRATQGPPTWPVGKEGWLNKQSEGMLGKKWQKRWFVLNDKDLRYRCATPLGPAQWPMSICIYICICIYISNYV